MDMKRNKELNFVMTMPGAIGDQATGDTAAGGAEVR